MDMEIEMGTKEMSDSGIEADNIAANEIAREPRPDGIEAEPDAQATNVVAIQPTLKLTGSKCSERLTTLALNELTHGQKSGTVATLLAYENITRCKPMLTRAEVFRCLSEAQTKAPSRKIKSNAPPQTRILSGQHWLKYEPSTTDQYIIGTPENSVVRPGTLNVIVAQEKALKTTFMLPFMLGVATAMQIYSRLPVSPRKPRVLYLHGEMSDPEIAERTKSALRKYKMPETDLANFLQGRVTDGHLIDLAGQEHIRALVETHKAEIVVFDTWQSFIAGNDENSFKDVSAALRFIQRLINDFGVTVFVPIHRGKNASHGMRGHSALAGARDTLIELTIEKESPTKIVRVRVEPRWGTPPAPFSIKWEDGTAVEIDDSLFEPDRKNKANQSEKIRDFVDAMGGCATRAEIAAKFKFAPDALRQAIRRAIQAKHVFEDMENNVCVEKIAS